MIEQNSVIKTHLNDYLSDLGYTKNIHFWDIFEFLRKKNSFYQDIFLKNLDTGEQYTYEDLYIFIEEIRGELRKTHSAGYRISIRGLEGLSLIASHLAVWSSSGYTAVIQDDSIDTLIQHINWLVPDFLFSSDLIELDEYRLISSIRSGAHCIYIYKRKQGAMSISLPGEVAYIAFTSGTTGPSKGVLLSHENLIAMSFSMYEATKNSGASNVFLPVPLSHMYGMSVALSCLLNGMTISLMSKTGDFQNSIQKIQNFGVDALALQPKHIREIIDNAIVFEMINSSLKFIACASGNLTEIEMKKLRKNVSIDMYMYYALTEAPRAVFCKNPHYLPEEDMMSIGNPGMFMSIELREKTTINSLPEIGEIVLSGSMVAIGYFFQNGVTQLFQNQSFSTGDLGYLKNSRYFWFGRKKDIIFLSEDLSLNPITVENFLLSQGLFKECLLLLDKENSTLKLLFSSPLQEISGEKLGSLLASVLGDTIAQFGLGYKWIEVPEILKNSNGKVLRDIKNYF